MLFHTRSTPPLCLNQLLLRTINRLAGFTIGFNSLQIAAIYGKLDLDYHAIAQSFFDALSFFNFDLGAWRLDVSSSSF